MAGWNITLKRGESKVSAHVCFCDKPSLPTQYCALGSANGGSKSCIFGMPSEQVVIGSVWRGGGMELTWGSGLLIEWWKTDSEWEGMADIDGWIDRWIEQKDTGWMMHLGEVSPLSDVPPPSRSHLAFTDLSWKKSLVSRIFHYSANPSHFPLCSHTHTHTSTSTFSVSFWTPKHQCKGVIPLVYVRTIVVVKKNFIQPVSPLTPSPAVSPYFGPQSLL